MPSLLYGYFLENFLITKTHEGVKGWRKMTQAWDSKLRLKNKKLTFIKVKAEGTKIQNNMGQ